MLKESERNIHVCYEGDADAKRDAARHNNFIAIYARDCDVRRVTRAEAAEFLGRYHSLGLVPTARYRYGLILRRPRFKVHGDISVLPGRFKAGDIVAVSTFSPPRLIRDCKSVEWVRYASLPDVRVEGGMGKILDVLLAEVGPDDIRTYADALWSEGDVYRKLGFLYEGTHTFPSGATSHIFRLPVTSLARKVYSFLPALEADPVAEVRQERQH